MADYDITMEYKRLKLDADNAENMYQQTQSVMDWEWFMTCEMKASEYAFIHEEEIDWSAV